MGYSPQQFQVQGANDKPFALCSQQAVSLLESVTAAEKAQAVPRVLIWQVDPVTGNPVHKNRDGSPKRPLSLSYVLPPAFGSQTDQRYRERAPVSLERVSIKSKNPRGEILYHVLEMAFVVHRPDVVFQQDDGTGDRWSSLIELGNVHAIEYGWSASAGVKNGLLNGTGFSDRQKGVFVPARKQLRFVVTSYNFEIDSAGQIHFTLTAFDDGEHRRRQAFIVDKQKTTESTPEKQFIADWSQGKEIDPFADDGNPLASMLKRFQSKVSANAKGQGPLVSGPYVPFGLLMDEMFYDLLKDSFTEQGYSLSGVFVGLFNSRAGKPAGKFLGSGGSMSDQPISDFSIPMDDVERIFRNLFEAGYQLTLDNFMLPFLRLMCDAATWDRGDDVNASSRTLPHINMRTIYNRNSDGKMSAAVYIFDSTREFTKFTDDDAKKLPRTAKSHAEVKEIVTGKGIPFVSLGTANSYVQAAHFANKLDPQQQAILMRRYLSDASAQTRDQLVNTPTVAAKQNRKPSAIQIFAPSIKGELTMLGNFLLDVFALLWVDFGVPAWDGPYNVLEVEDTIESGKFTTTVTLIAAGTDPLGTQGRNTA